MCAPSLPPPSPASLLAPRTYAPNNDNGHHGRCCYSYGRRGWRFANPHRQRERLAGGAWGGQPPPAVAMVRVTEALTAKRWLLEEEG